MKKNPKCIPVNNEMKKLVTLLKGAKISYTLTRLYGGWKLIINELPHFDAICHYYSYGGKEGLLEIMGLLDDEESQNDTVVGFLTAENVFNRITKALGVLA